MDFIKVYDNVLSEEQCSHYINLIENGPQVPGKVANTSREYQPEVKKSWDVCFSNHYPEEIPALLDITVDLFKRYHAEFNTRIPMNSCELFNARVYREGEGFYKTHIDAADGVTKARTVTVLMYLNDVEEGGEIEFPLQGKKFKPKAGRVVIFPSAWTHPHAAHIPTKGDRYIIRTFMLTD